MLTEQPLLIALLVAGPDWKKYGGENFVALGQHTRVHTCPIAHCRQQHFGLVFAEAES
jgi:hypothetical protein